MLMGYIGDDPACIMHMSNLLRVELLTSPVMAAKRAPLGISHLTVIPSNFEPEPDGESNDDEEFSIE
jgi:hypothetical protein